MVAGESGEQRRRSELWIASIVWLATGPSEELLIGLPSKPPGEDVGTPPLRGGVASGDRRVKGAGCPVLYREEQVGSGSGDGGCRRIGGMVGAQGSRLIGQVACNIAIPQVVVGASGLDDQPSVIDRAREIEGKRGVQKVSRLLGLALLHESSRCDHRSGGAVRWGVSAGGQIEKRRHLPLLQVVLQADGEFPAPSQLLRRCGIGEPARFKRIASKVGGAVHDDEGDAGLWAEIVRQTRVGVRCDKPRNEQRVAKPVSGRRRGPQPASRSSASRRRRTGWSGSSPPRDRPLGSTPSIRRCCWAG